MISLQEDGYNKATILLCVAVDCCPWPTNHLRTQAPVPSRASGPNDAAHSNANFYSLYKIMQRAVVLYKLALPGNDECA